MRKRAIASSSFPARKRILPSSCWATTSVGSSSTAASSSRRASASRPSETSARPFSRWASARAWSDASRDGLAALRGGAPGAEGAEKDSAAADATQRMRRIPGRYAGGGRLVDFAIEDGRDAHPVSDAQRDERPPLPGALELVEGGGDQHRSRRSQRVAEGDGASV